MGLPPLVIIGIPLTVKGASENPKVKLSSKGEDIEETEYSESPEKSKSVTTEKPSSEEKK